ncbi:putative ATP-dependent RNA helicase [Cotonvirus japonicus]|uniref:RNA helicase n=1 Tax=Cotonvirus japonicus TaxID=2811091 RepID=A0ABM7NSP9_9VIRU|nr:putative ATP-dependent RNA helicase [Cotonvirus japonicus]BCS83194.1 putative ATP-dependent RNA helicase [Cotonvirus japonicus]
MASINTSSENNTQSSSINKNYISNGQLVYTWISIDSDRYDYIKLRLIDVVFPVLDSSDKLLLLNSIVTVINMIYMKFGFYKNPEKSDVLLWNQLTQNKLLDMRAILNMMLPYISDNATDDKKHKLTSLENLYLEKDSRGQYVYTNMQYNRCIRQFDNNNNIVTTERPFIREYFVNHLELLLMSIETCSNKLYVNWVDVLPITMTNFTNTSIYHQTISKIHEYDDVDKSLNREMENPTIPMINTYIDPKPGLTFQDIYNTMSNHLFGEIKNHKWLIYDIIVNDKPLSYVKYLKNKFDLDVFWNSIMWSQLTSDGINIFTKQWNTFFNSSDNNDNIVLHHIYFFFSKYHKNAQTLIRQGKLILDHDPDDEENEEEENVRITPEVTQNARRGLENVPIDEIYLFFYDQLSSFKKSWYYYVLEINNRQYLASSENIFVTPKNIYNYCKSLVSYINSDNKFIQIPKLWYSLKPEFINMILIRLLDIRDPIQNNWSNSKKSNWFNINSYFRKFYPDINENDLPNLNYKLHMLIRDNIVNIIFESLVYHGLLSDFHPNPTISDNSFIESTIGSTVDRKKTAFKWQEMRKQYFSGDKRTEFEKQAYYYITGSSYGDLAPLSSKSYTNFQMKYFDFMTSNQIWTFTYAMNWVSQINFYHHYVNDRVLYITGATGVGKSTQVPKLLMYSQRMLDYNSNGKTICTQPRISPTVENADTISRELGVPLRGYNSTYDKSVFTNNYYVQYKYQKEQHTSKLENSFLRIVTDGTLLEEILNSPFLTRSKKDDYATNSRGEKLDWVKTYMSGNTYDIIIVDEAHEHNANMDMILTLARDAVHVNNSLKLVIVSATMDDDEPIYRRYYRRVNDNRMYPLSAFIEFNNLDRANMDRRIHISPPGATTQYVIRDFYLTEAESEYVNQKTYRQAGINKTIEIANSTTSGDILLFMTGQADIHASVAAINAATPANIVAMGFYSELSEQEKTFIVKIHQTLSSYTRYKDDVELDENEITRRVPPGTYNRAIIIATNVAEASITLQNLRYVVDTGYAKTLVYDPLTNSSDTYTLPISYSSSLQRRGRVGRVESGDFYALYSLEKIINNKTAYKIADSDIKNLVIKLLKSEPDDSFIISPENDINQISILDEFSKKQKTLVQTERIFNKDFLLFEVLKNPRSYTDIISKQYLYIPNINDVTQYYTYYGQKNNVTNIKSMDYLVNNHDDYEFQRELKFFSRCHTGYDSFILEDRNTFFYIIHPDENIITRNLYTGKMIAIKNSEAVTPAYYYYLMEVNKIQKLSDFTTKKQGEFVLIKYPLAILDAKLEMSVTDIPVKRTDMIIKYSNIIDPMIRQYVQYYFDTLLNINYNNITTIKSKLFNHLKKIQSMSGLNILNNLNNLLWYCYAIPSKLETDVLALMTMIDIAPDLKQWIKPNNSRKVIAKFFNIHYSNQGDIYFFWDIWNKIKKIMTKYNLFNIINISDLKIHFITIKQKFLSQEKIPFNDYMLLDNMFKSGKLNVEDEFYNYVSAMTIDNQTILNDNIIEEIDILANNEIINSETIQNFVIGYVNIAFILAKTSWMYEYEVTNKLNEDDTEQESIFEWINKNLRFSNIFIVKNRDLSIWEKIIESYIRAFSTNLVKNLSDFYLKINNGMIIPKSTWSSFNPREKTFLNNKTEYIIYQTIVSVNSRNSIVFMTPVKLEWVLNANPIYYYFLFFDKNNILSNLEDNTGVILAKNIIEKNKISFSVKSLLEYVNQINDPIISNIIHKNIYNLRQNKTIKTYT